MASNLLSLQSLEDGGEVAQGRLGRLEDVIQFHRLPILEIPDELAGAFG